MKMIIRSIITGAILSLCTSSIWAATQSFTLRNANGVNYTVTKSVTLYANTSNTYCAQPPYVPAALPWCLRTFNGNVKLQHRHFWQDFTPQEVIDADRYICYSSTNLLMPAGSTHYWIQPATTRYGNIDYIWRDTDIATDPYPYVWNYDWPYTWVNDFAGDNIVVEVGAPCQTIGGFGYIGGFLPGYPHTPSYVNSIVHKNGGYGVYWVTITGNSVLHVVART